jgi:hypothetical protein
MFTHLKTQVLDKFHRATYLDWRDVCRPKDLWQFPGGVYEPETSWIWSKSANHSITMFSKVMLYSSYANIIQRLSSDEESAVICCATILFKVRSGTLYYSHVFASSMPHTSWNTCHHHILCTFNIVIVIWRKFYFSITVRNQHFDLIYTNIPQIFCQEPAAKWLSEML